MAEGERIKALRLKRGMSQVELADTIGVTKQSLYKYENGIITNIPSDKIEELATALLTTPAYLMGWDDDPNDWETIGGEQGIYPPRDYEGDYSDYVKFSVMGEHEDFIDSYYDIYNEAIEYLKSNGYFITNKDDYTLAISKDGKTRVIHEADLISNYERLGHLKPKAELLLIPPLHVLAERSTGVKIPVLGRVAAGVPIEAIQDVLGEEEITEDMASTGEFFGLRISGDSMSPDIQDGDTVIVKQQNDAESGDIVIVYVNGHDATCKRLRKYRDGVELVPINPSYDTKFYSDVEIEKTPVKIIGRVMESRRKF